MIVIKYVDNTDSIAKREELIDWLVANVGEPIESTYANVMSDTWNNVLSHTRERCYIAASVVVTSIHIITGINWELYHVGHNHLYSLGDYVLYVLVRDEVLALQCKLATL